MNKLNKLIFIIPFLILGCRPSVVDETRFLQRINSLDMNIFSNEGKKVLTINSPDTSYDKEKLTFNLKETEIKIFEDNKTKYIINSDESKLYNNNQIIELTSNVELRTLDMDDDILLTDKFIWNIEESNYLLLGNVKFENKTIILSAYKATLDSGNIIEFYNPVKYIIKDRNSDTSYEINSQNAYYNMKTNTVRFGSKDKRVRTRMYF